MSDLSEKLSAVLNQLPVAVALIDSSGRFVGKSGRMAGLLGDVVPSRSREQRRLWGFTDSSGSTIAPVDWPSAKALRGEVHPEGMIGTFRKDQDYSVKIISLPFQVAGTDIAAICFAQFMERERRVDDAIQDDLQVRLLASLIRAMRGNLS